VRSFVLRARRRRPDGVESQASPPHADTVLFVSHVRHFGGSLVSLRVVLQQLEGRVRRVLAVPSSGQAGPLLMEERPFEEHLSLRWRPRGTGFLIGSIAAIGRLLVWLTVNRRRVVAVHANGMVDLLLVGPAVLVTRVPVVVWVHEGNLAHRRSTRLVRIFGRLHRRVRWVALSRAGAAAIEHARLADTEAIAVVPNPIDLSSVVGTHLESDGRVRIGFLGTDSAIKGFDLLPQVIDALVHEDVQFLIFARRHEELSPECARAWDQLVRFPETRVLVAGRQDDVREAFGRCDIVFCPSRAESFCRVAAEGMANGLPVVASDLATIGDVLDDGRAGVLFPTGDSAGAAAALQSLVNNPRLRKELGEAGLCRVHDFAPSRVARQLEGLYFADKQPMPTADEGPVSAQLGRGPRREDQP
jgi:phosphatidyl-myo-inositol alpha-mannosyltransferase